MWKVDSSGEYSFSDGVDPSQAILFTPNPASQFAPQLWEHYRGKTLYTEEILVYARDETPFLDKHTRGALNLLESNNGVNGHRIYVEEWKRDGTMRRKGTFPKGVSVSFKIK